MKDQRGKDRRIELRGGGYRAVIDRKGAALQGLWWTPSSGDGVEREVPLTETYEGESPYSCGHTLVPWPNRIANGTFTFEKQLVTLPVSEPALRNAIHGLAIDVWWEVAECAADGSYVTFTWRYVPELGQGWPWACEVAVRYAVSGEGLEVGVVVTNHSARSMPWGYGAHPYVTAGGAPLDECTLTARVDEWWATDERNLPTGGHAPVGEGVPDLSSPTMMAGVWFDTPFTVASPAAGMVEADDCGGWLEVARLSGRQPGGFVLSVVMETDGSFPWLQIFTTGSETVPFPGKESQEGRAVAIEPMTCPPNAMVSGRDVIVISPQSQWAGQWRLRGERSTIS